MILPKGNNHVVEHAASSDPPCQQLSDTEVFSQSLAKVKIDEKTQLDGLTVSDYQSTS